MRISRLMAGSLAVAGLGIAGVVPVANAEETDSATTNEVMVSASVRLAGIDRYETSQVVSEATKLESVLVSDTAPDALIGALQAANDNKSAVMSPDAPGLGGATRYESAARAALSGDKNVPLVVANGTSTVDILAATSYAANRNGNLLLTKSDRLGDHAAAAIAQLQPSEVTVIGGTGVVSDKVKDAIASISGKTVARISGADRYQTALAVAQATGTSNYLLVNGKNPVDAYTLAPLVKTHDAAVVLVQTTCAPKAVRDALQGKHLTAIGGKAAISDNFAAKTCEQQAAEAAEAARIAAEKAAAKAAAAAAAAAAANPYGAGTPQGIAYDLLDDFGWGKEQMDPLINLWMRESGWNTNAGRTNGPYGIPQANPGYKMSSAGADWATNPATQIRWGLGYIKGRYGSPAAAWGHFQARSWY